MDLHKRNILRLNSNFMRLGWTAADEAFCMLMGESKDGRPPALVVEVVYDYDEFGRPILDKYARINTWSFEDWMTLPPRLGDLDEVIHTSKRIIRIPSIILCSHFHLMPTKDIKPSPSAIRKRDGNRCQYTGVELTKSTFSLDHIVPKSKGGKDSWQNLVAAHKEVNSRKGNQFNHEVGLKLLKQPKAPKLTPLCSVYTEVFHPDHKHF